MNKLLLDPFSFSTFPKQLNTTIGFEPILKRLAEMNEAMPKIPTYPPYNIIKEGENSYKIEIAVAGFREDEIDITVKDYSLTVIGEQKRTEEDVTYLHKGISARNFTRPFTLGDHVEIKNAVLINGMLKIWLERFIPEDKKPKKIPIGEAETKHNGEATKQFLTEKYGDK